MDDTLVVVTTPANEEGNVRVTVRTGSPNANLDRDTVWSGWFRYEKANPGPRNVRMEGPSQIRFPYPLNDHSVLGKAAIGDLDADGHKDIVFFSQYQFYSAALRVAWNRGPETFVLNDTPIWILPYGTRRYRVKIREILCGDVTGDGLTDVLLIAGTETANLHLVVQESPGQLVHRWSISGSSRGVELIDFDGDGKSEIYFGRAGSLYDETGHLIQKLIVPGYDTLQGMDAWIDIDADGDPDLVALSERRNLETASTRRCLYLFRNTGDRLREGEVLLEAPEFYIRALAAADLGGDGDDLIIAGSHKDGSDAELRIYQNVAEGMETVERVPLGFPPLRVNHDAVLVPWDRDEDGSDEVWVSVGHSSLSMGTPNPVVGLLDREDRMLQFQRLGYAWSGLFLQPEFMDVSRQPPLGYQDRPA